MKKIYSVIGIHIFNSEHAGDWINESYHESKASAEERMKEISSLKVNMYDEEHDEWEDLQIKEIEVHESPNPELDEVFKQLKHIVDEYFIEVRAKDGSSDMARDVFIDNDVIVIDTDLFTG